MRDACCDGTGGDIDVTSISQIRESESRDSLEIRISRFELSHNTIESEVLGCARYLEPRTCDWRVYTPLLANDVSSDANCAFALVVMFCVFRF